MTDEQLSKTWTAITGFLLVFCLDSWLRTQGLDPMFGSELPHDQRSSAALFGFIITAVAIPFQIYVARLYTARKSGTFSSRLPIAFFESLDMDQPVARTYQRFMYFGAHVLPLLAIIHFYRLVILSSYHVQSDCQIEIVNQSIGVWRWPDEYVWTDGFRLGDCDGVTFFPVVEPALLTLLGVYVFALSLLYLRLLLRTKP